MSDENLMKIRSLRLDKPLVVFDLETTGVSIQHDRIVSICVAKILPDDGIEVKTRLVNPQVPIPPEAIEVHGITDEDVKDQPTFPQMAKSLNAYLENCDLAGFNIIYYDIPLLMNEFNRTTVEFSMHERKVVDAYQIFRRREPRTLAAAMEHYCNEELKDAHNCEADVLATIKVFEAQLHHYGDLPHTVDELDQAFNPRTHQFVDWEGKLRWDKGQVVIGFGQKRGTALRLLVQEDRSYLEWILDGDFSGEVKQVVASALNGEYPEPPPGVAKEKSTVNEANTPPPDP